jgi:hypothetical protein
MFLHEFLLEGTASLRVILAGLLVRGGGLQNSKRAVPERSRTTPENKSARNETTIGSYDFEEYNHAYRSQ